MTKFEDQSKHYQAYLNIGIVWVTLVLIMFLLTSCYVYESSYVAPEQEHPTKVYYYNDLPYWGFYNNYYYYYGVPHMYPWWYYYTIIPHYTYSIHTHVTIHCNTGYYVSRPRGPKFNNNRGGSYKPNNTMVKTNRTNIRTNTNRTNIRTNTNKTNIKTNTNRTNINKNNNKTNIRTNTNKNRTNINKNRTNINRNNKVNINRNNSKRTNKSNVRKPR